MRLGATQLALALALCYTPTCHAIDWNPFNAKGGAGIQDGTPARVADAAPAAAAAASASSPPAADEFNHGFAADPLPEQDVTASVALGDASPSETGTASVPTMFQPLPTPKDFFNGDKPKAYEYFNGKTYTAWKDRIVFRPSIYKQEGIALIVLLLGFLASRSNKDVNLQLGLKWLNKNDEVLDEAFTEITAGSGSDGSKAGRFIREINSTKYAAWVTGRKNLKGMEITFDLKPRTDVISAVYQFARSLADFTYKPAEDRITLDVHFVNADDTCVLAVCDKDVMSFIRKNDWSVRAFTTLATSNIGLPDSFAIFHETYSSAENVIKALDGGLVEWLKGTGRGQEYFESLVLSDLSVGDEPPTEEQMCRPEALRKKRKLTMTLKMPSKNNLGGTVPPLTLLINLADTLASGKVATSQAEMGRIKKRRADIFDNLTRDYRKEQSEEAAEKARELRKKEQELKYNALSPEQQKKRDELEKRRSERKAQGKAQVQRR